MGNFKHLKAWQQARELSLELHQLLKTRRMSDQPGMRAQMLRAADSIPSNLAEGCAKDSTRELGRFAETAYASTKELESHLILCRDRDALTQAEFENLSTRADHVARLCFGLMRRARTSADAF